MRKRATVNTDVALGKACLLGPLVHSGTRLWPLRHSFLLPGEIHPSLALCWRALVHQLCGGPGTPA